MYMITFRTGMMQSRTTVKTILPAVIAAVLLLAKATRIDTPTTMYSTVIVSATFQARTRIQVGTASTQLLTRATAQEAKKTHNHSWCRTYWHCWSGHS